MQDPEYLALWEEEFNYLNTMLLRKLTFFFALQTQGRGPNIVEMLLDLKEKLSAEWLEDFVARYCLNNKMMLPQENWQTG